MVDRITRSNSTDPLLFSLQQAAEGMTDRFLQEARIAAHLQHPNIIIVHDVRQFDALMYFVMNLVEGASVDEVMRSARLTFD